MSAPEGIVDINIAEPGQRSGKDRIVFLFFGMKADILKQRYSAVAQVCRDVFSWFADAIVRERYRFADKFLQPSGDRTKRIFFHWLSLRPAEMRHEDDLCAMLSQIVNRRQRLADARVIRDDLFSIAFLQRDVEVHPHENAFTFHFNLS